MTIHDSKKRQSGPSAAGWHLTPTADVLALSAEKHESPPIGNNRQIEVGNGFVSVVAPAEAIERARVNRLRNVERGWPWFRCASASGEVLAGALGRVAVRQSD